jgi:hypothetical protein
LKSALTLGSSHAAACGTRALIAVHLDNAAWIDGLFRNASLVTFASVKLPEATSALSADRAKPVRQAGNNVNRRKGNGFMAHSFGSEREFEVVPTRGRPRALPPIAQIKRMQSRSNDGAVRSANDALKGRKFSSSPASE